MLRKRKPPREAKAAIAITVAPENGMERKKRRSIRGSARRGSQRRSPIREAIVTAKAAMISREVQPRLGASMMP